MAGELPLVNKTMMYLHSRGSKVSTGLATSHLTAGNYNNSIVFCFMGSLSCLLTLMGNFQAGNEEKWVSAFDPILYPFPLILLQFLFNALLSEFMPQHAGKDEQFYIMFNLAPLLKVKLYISFFSSLVISGSF